MSDGDDSQAAIDVVRSLVDRVVLTPAAKGEGFEVEFVGEIAVMIAAGLEPVRCGSQGRISASGSDMFLRSIKLVAGARNRLDLLLAG